MAPLAWLFCKTTGQTNDLDLVVVVVAVVTSPIFCTETIESLSYSHVSHNQILEMNVLDCFVRSNPS